MKLLIEDDEGNRSVVPVIRDEITIGRKEGNTIRLTERNVSRRHARLVRRSGDLFVEDVEARYGIKKNGQKIDDRASFGEGDVVSIGDYRLTLRPEKVSDSSVDTNGEAAAEISSDLQNRATQVTKLEDVEGAPAKSGESGGQPGPSGGAQNRSQTEVLEAEPAELVVVSSNFAGQEFPLDRDEMVIGRGDDCDIIIDHRSVSNTHAKVVREGPANYKIVDLNSRNGVKIDGEEYKSVHLERGDVVTLGHVKFRFVEPGENYVFSPQSAGAGQSNSMEAASTGSADPTAVSQSPAAGAPSSSSSSGMNPVVLGSAAVALLAVVGLGIFMMSGGSSDKEPKAADNNVGGAATKPTDSESKESNPKVARRIAKAEKSIENGELETAVTILETLRSVLDPSPDQNAKIDELLTKASTEKPFQKAFKQAKTHVDDEAWKKALGSLDEIPPHSIFSDIAREEGVVGEALDGRLEQARAALEGSEFEKARKIAEAVNQWEPRKQEAQKLLDAIESARQDAQKAQAAVTNNPPAGSGSGGGGTSGGGRPANGTGGGATTGVGRPANGTGGGTTTGGGSGTTGGGGQPEPTDQVSKAQAKKLFRGATKKWIRGDHTGAISDCRKALKGGYSPCYRVMGMASKQMGNKSQACGYFKKYLTTSPSDASKIRNQMDSLGCN